MSSSRRRHEGRQGGANREATTQRAAVLARRTHEAPAEEGTMTGLSAAEIQWLVGSFERFRDATGRADLTTKGEVYRSCD